VRQGPSWLGAASELLELSASGRQTKHDFPGSVVSAAADVKLLLWLQGAAVRSEPASTCSHTDASVVHPVVHTHCAVIRRYVTLKSGVLQMQVQQCGNCMGRYTRFDSDFEVRDDCTTEH
jgi:hypothetical protein